MHIHCRYSRHCKLQRGHEAVPTWSEWWHRHDAQFILYEIWSSRRFGEESRRNTQVLCDRYTRPNRSVYVVSIGHYNHRSAGNIISNSRCIRNGCPAFEVPDHFHVQHAVCLFDFVQGTIAVHRGTEQGMSETSNGIRLVFPRILDIFDRNSFV